MSEMIIIIGKVNPNQRPAIYLGERGDKIGLLQPGDTIRALENDGQWLHLSQINTDDVSAKNWWTTAGGQGQYIEWHWQTVEEPDPEPTTGPRPVRARLELDDGTVWDADNFTQVLE